MTLPFEPIQIFPKRLGRRSFIGGSDARIIMGSDEAALLRLWREKKRGEIEPDRQSPSPRLLRKHTRSQSPHSGQVLADA
jgi:hypothetical protein